MDYEKKQMASRSATAYPAAVWLVSTWTLSTACLFLVTSALVETLDRFDIDIPCSPVSKSSSVLVLPRHVHS